MDIWNALRRAGRDDITTLAVISNTVKEMYNKTVEIQSVKLLWKKILIKTWNSLVNSELQLLEWDIKKASLKKLEKLWIKIKKDCVMRFV